MTDVAQFREFVSPHDYVYQDCVIYRGVMYQCNNLQGTGGRWISHDWDIFISSELTEEVAEISETLASTIVAMNDEITSLKTKIDCFNRLFGLLVFELQDQGIKIESEELINKTNYI